MLFGKNYHILLVFCLLKTLLFWPIFRRRGRLKVFRVPAVKDMIKICSRNFEVLQVTYLMIYNLLYILSCWEIL